MTDAGNDAVAEFAGRISALHRQTESARAALADTTGTAGSPDGAVRVSVDTAGVLTGIEFGAAARDLPAGELAKTVLQTVRQARVAVLREAEDRVAEAVGEFSEAVAVLRRQRAELEEPSGAQPPAPSTPASSAPPSPARPHPASAPDEDESDGGFAGRGR